tara:strand:- start:793 stop:1158 length:366 start_codon:yes stop_codon:yes gene_type:complete
MLTTNKNNIIEEILIVCKLKNIRHYNRRDGEKKWVILKYKNRCLGIIIENHNIGRSSVGLLTTTSGSNKTDGIKLNSILKWEPFGKISKNRFQYNVMGKEQHVLEHIFDVAIMVCMLNNKI